MLTSDEPGITYLARIELQGDDPAAPDLQSLAAAIPTGPKASALLEFEDLQPYSKWRGSHWRLVSLAELGLQPGEPRSSAALDQVLDLWTGEPHRARFSVVDGLARFHASQEGNALAVACRLGAASDPRAARLAERLCSTQWPDGGWNCDVRSTGHSSFHETLAPTWGLIEHHRATGEPRSLEAAQRAAELFLRHGLFKSTRTGRPIHHDFTRIHWPPYWHYDFLQALRVLAPLGVLGDPRADDAYDLLASRRLPDGTWRTGGRWWRPPSVATRRTGQVEAVDWGTTADEMATLNALRALAARR